jgi:hypothetical protein
LTLVLTRIDVHDTFKEKLGVDGARTDAKFPVFMIGYVLN